MKISFKKTIKINGKQYDRLEDVPAALREAYHQAKAAADAANANRVPEIIADDGGKRRIFLALLALAAIVGYFVVRFR